MRTFIFKHVRNESASLSVDAETLKVARAAMANLVANCDDWAHQFDFDMDDADGLGSEDALDHIDEEFEEEDWDDDMNDDLDETDWSDDGVVYREDLYDDNKGYN
jgi:hypothetical protein